MSGLLMGHAFYEKLPALPKLLLLAIADHANDDGHGAYPSQSRLAEKVGCSTRHINTLTSTLVSLGLLEITQQGGGRGHTTRYLLPWAEEVRRKIKGEKVEQTTIKAELQSSSEPSIEPSDSSEPLSESEIPPPSPPQAAFRTTVTAFYEAPQKRKVGALIDMARSLGIKRSGMAAALIRDFGAGKEIVDALKDAASEARGDPWEYMRKVLGNGQESQLRNRRLDTDGRAGNGGQSVAQGGSEILTEEEARRLLAARADAEGRGGAGSPAQSED